MDNLLENKAVVFLDQVNEILKNGTDAVSQELPSLCQEYIHFIFIYNSIVIGFFIVAWAILILLLIYFYKKMKLSNNSDDFPDSVNFVIIWIISSITLVATFIEGGQAVKNLVAVKTMPKVLLVEKASELIGGK